MRRPRLLSPPALALLGVIGASPCIVAAQGAPPPRAAAARPPAAFPTGNAEVRGLVLEAQGGTAVGGASISVRTARGGALVAGAVAGADGRFRVRGLPPGAYALRVAHLGYAPLVRPFAITAPEQRVEVDSLRLARVAVTLSEVQVREQAAAVTLEPDRNSYRAKELAPGAANASEVLEQVPSVQVDAEGRVSLRGNENVVVQINGRPTPLRGAALASFLRQLPGPVVERIEVVPNPSVKYDPEGMAGTLNIVLRQDTDLGASGGFNVNAMNQDRLNAGGNLGYQVGRLSLFGSYGYNGDGRALEGVNNRARFDALRALTSTTLQDYDGTMDVRGHNVTGNMDVRVTPRDLLSQSLLVNVRSAGENSSFRYTELDARGTVTDRYLRPRNQAGEGFVLDYTAAWKRTFAPRRHELTSEIRVNRTVDADAITLSRTALDGVSGLREVEAQDIDARATQLTAQLDYVRPLGRAAKLETGYRGNSRWLERDFVSRLDPEGAGRWGAGPLSNSFGFDEHVQAAYGLVSRPVGRKVEAQGGLRAEYTSRLFALSADRHPYDYVSVFPSASVAYTAGQATTARLSYSRRIRRPGTQELNPFPQFMDAQNVFVGNPNLRPEFTDALELGVTRSGRLGTLQVSPFFRRTTDVIRIEIEPEARVQDRPVTTVSFVNLATSTSYGGDVNGTFKLGRRFSGISTFNVFRLVTDGGSASALASNAILWSTRLNGTMSWTPRFATQVVWTYRAPQAIERGRFDALQMVTLVLRQQVMGEKGLLTLRVVDPFNTNHFGILTGTDRVQQYTTRWPGVRGAFLGFQYNTGSAPRLRQPRQDPQPAAPSTGFPG